MAVGKVVGYYNDHEILFNKLSETVFSAAFPTDLRGSIILELYAVDMAGNVGTHKESIVLIDFKNLTAGVLQTKTEAHQRENSQYQAKEFCSDYRLKVLGSGGCL